VKPDEIGVADIASTGNVEAALENYYADRVAAVAKATGVKEKTLRHWIDRHLISEAGVRVEVLKDAGGVEGITDTAVDALEAAHLIRTDQRSGATSLELAHDRLVTPIRADNAEWFERHLSLLQQQAALWERQGRKDAVLLRDNALHKARAWADANPAELTTVDRAFLEASEKDERSRSFSFYVQWAVGSSVAVIVAAGFALAAWLQREEARTQEGNAKNQATIASARGLASLAYRLFDERLDLATLLAYEAFKKQTLPETRATVLPRFSCSHA
jgi:hypothetical protein